MNIGIQLRLIKDNLFKVIIYLIMTAVTTILVILAVTGLGNYNELKYYFPDSMQNLYIYSYDSDLYDMNHSNGIGVISIGHNDYSDIMNERIELLKKRFDVTEIIYTDSEFFLHYKADNNASNDLYINAYNYNNSVLRNVSIKVTEGRLPKENETNVIILPSSYKNSFKVNEEYYFYIENLLNNGTEGESSIRVKVIGFFENPFCFNPSNLALQMDEYIGIVYLADDAKPVVNNFRTVFFKTDSEIPEKELRRFMNDLRENPDNLYRYDPGYEYNGERYAVSNSIDKVKREILISFVLLFVVVFADTYLGLRRTENFILTIMKLGCARRNAILNAIGYKLPVTFAGLITGSIIYRYNCYEVGIGRIGGIAITEYTWSLKYAITAMLIVLAVCLFAHIPYVLKVLSIDIQREE